MIILDTNWLKSNLSKGTTSRPHVHVKHDKMSGLNV